ncbi:MAG TPA: hypothetical protein VFM45_13930, partial [Anaeromyxobacteraceae bacterium]|nr:hypothetical protein [Anaeromyxobacteraceae bacterium]
FFTGGIMPAHDLIARVPSPFEVEARWFVDGTHYQRTAEAWLARLDAHRGRAEAALATAHPAGEVALQVGRWRLFFLACAELFGFADGQEWGVSHALLRPRRGRA